MLASSDRHGVGQGRARFGYNAVNPSVCTNRGGMTEAVVSWMLIYRG